MRDDDLLESDAPEEIILADPSLDVPGYLFEPDAIKEEARRAFALRFVTSSDSVLSPTWKKDVKDVHEWLEKGAFSAEISTPTFRAKV